MLIRPSRSAASAIGARDVAPLAATDVDVNETFFAGHFYGANIGWVNLGTSDLHVQNINRPDTDGIDDHWDRK